MSNQFNLLNTYSVISRDAYVMFRAAHEMQRTGLNSYRPGRRWDGGVVKGKSYPNIWEKIAKFMLRNNLDPAPCIEWRFRQGMGRYPVRPNQIAAAAYLEDYQQVCKLGDREIRADFHSERQTCRYELDNIRQMGYAPKESLRIVLCDSSLELSGLFRYCLASSESMNRLAKSFLPPAIVQYLANAKGYKQIWKRWLPVKFIEQAEDARDAAVVPKSRRRMVDG